MTKKPEKMILGFNKAGRDAVRKHIGRVTLAIISIPIVILVLAILMIAIFSWIG